MVFSKLITIHLWTVHFLCAICCQIYIALFMLLKVEAQKEQNKFDNKLNLKGMVFVKNWLSYQRRKKIKDWLISLILDYNRKERLRTCSSDSGCDVSLENFDNFGEPGNFDLDSSIQLWEQRINHLAKQNFNQIAKLSESTKKFSKHEGKYKSLIHIFKKTKWKEFPNLLLFKGLNVQ